MAGDLPALNLNTRIAKYQQNIKLCKVKICKDYLLIYIQYLYLSPKFPLR